MHHCVSLMSASETVLTLTVSWSTGLVSLPRVADRRRHRVTMCKPHEIDGLQLLHSPKWHQAKSIACHRRPREIQTLKTD